MDAEQPSNRRASVTTVGVAGVLLATAALIGRRLWFFSDDWNIYADYHSGNLLEPFNGHLSVVPAGLYQALFHGVGVGSYLPYRLLGLAALAVLAFQVARYSGRRVGPWAAAIAVAAVMWNSAGTTNVMFPFLMNFSLPIAALLAIWWHLDALGVGRESSGESAIHAPPSGTAHLVAIGLWAALALATSGLGVVAVAAVALEMAMRRAPWRAWLAIVLPSLVWFAWWISHREANEVSTDFGQVIAYFLRMLWAGTTSIAAGWAPGGLLLAAALVALVVASVVAERRLDPRAASALAAAVVFAGLTALTRQDTVPPIAPDELRYGWTIGAYFVLAAVASAAVLRTRIDALSTSLKSVAVTASVAVLAIGAVVLVIDMDSWTDTVTEAAPGLRSNIYAAEAAGAKRLDPDAVIRPLSFVPVQAGAYLDGVADVGSPLAGAGKQQIGGRADQRAAADELFFSAVPLELSVEPVPAAERECHGIAEVPPGSRVLVQSGVPDGAPLAEAPSDGNSTLTVSRFGDEPVVVLDVTESVVAYTLRLPEDAPVGTDVVVPYRLEGSDRVSVCVDAIPQEP